VNIPSIGKYKGVEIHDYQSAEGVANVVKPEIDYVHREANLAKLYAFATDFMHLS
jgi:hypothetical protein